MAIRTDLQPRRIPRGPGHQVRRVAFLGTVGVALTAGGNWLTNQWVNSEAVREMQAASDNPHGKFLERNEDGSHSFVEKPANPLKAKIEPTDGHVVVYQNPNLNVIVADLIPNPGIQYDVYRVFGEPFAAKPPKDTSYDVVADYKGKQVKGSVWFRLENPEDLIKDARGNPLPKVTHIQGANVSVLQPSATQ